MADLSKLARRRLGPPPPIEDASNNLQAPEVAPAAPQVAPAAALTLPSADVTPYQRVDGRTLRRTRRTLQFATKVSPETDRIIREIAAREGILIAELIEKMVHEYESLHSH